MYKIEVYVPVTHVEAVKSAMFAAGAGKIGNYDCCCFETHGTGQFRPLANSSPFIGNFEIIEKVAEIKLEMVCTHEALGPAIAAMKAKHPYETPAYQYFLVMGE